MKTKAILIVVVLVAIIGVWGIFRVSSNNVESAPALQATPQNAFMIIRSDNLLSIIDNLLDDNLIWANLSTISQIRDINNELALFDSLVNKYSDFLEVLETRQVVVSAHMLSRVKVGILLSTSLKNRSEHKDIEEQIRSLVNSHSFVQERNYDRAQIFDIKDKNDPRKNLSFSIHQGILVISKSAILVEKAIRQLNLNTGLLKNAEFRHSLNVAGKNVKGNIFINLKEIPQFLFSLAPSAEEKLNGLSRMGGWVELDLSTLHSKDWLLSGFTQAADSSSQIFSLFKKQDPVKPSVIKLLPQQTAFFQYIGLSDIYQFRRDYNRNLRKINQFDLYKHFVDNTRSKYGFHVELDFENNLEEEIAVSYTAQNLKIDKNSRYFIAKIRNRGNMVDLLQKTANKAENIDSVKAKSYTQKYKVNENTEITIWKFPVTNFSAKMYKLLLPEVNTSYATIINNYIVMGRTADGLKNFINSYHQNRTFETSPDFKNFIETLSSRSNFLIYSDVENSTNYWRNYLSNNMVNIVNKNRNMLNKFQAVALQISNSSDLLFTNIFIKLNSQGTLKPNVVWATHLEAPAEMKPAIVRNHITKDREVFIQDKNNKVYLIDKRGNILWTKKISENIISSVYQLDYYKNGKLQLAFNTENYLHLIDRLGNYVESYPIKLQAPATNGISVLDYEKKRNYRIFVAAKNKQIYVYDIKGKILKGWEFNLTENLVRGKIQHFVDKGLDFIVFSDDLKTYITDRRGKIRVVTKADFPRSNKNLFYLDKATKTHASRLLTTSISGTIMFVYLDDGKVTKMETSKFTPSHYFQFVDVDGDNLEDFVYADENRLKVYRQNLDEVFNLKLNNQLKSSPNIYNFGKENKQIGITDVESSEIFLIYGKNGETVTGFPLEGSTEFSITKFTKEQSKFNLIVGNKNNFLYNYLLK